MDRESIFYLAFYMIPFMDDTRFYSVLLFMLSTESKVRETE